MQILPFAWNVKAYFLAKIRKKKYHLSSAEVAQRVVTVKFRYLSRIAKVFGSFANVKDLEHDVHLSS